MTSLPFVEASPLRSFIDRYFEAWRGGIPGKVLGYFSEDAVINLWGPAETLAGKKMVAERWVIPTVTNYPGNVHQIKNFLEAGDQVAVEWLFTAVHVSTGKEINIPGCSVYWVSRGLIQRGNVYFSSAKAAGVGPRSADAGRPLTIGQRDKIAFEAEVRSPTSEVRLNQTGPPAPSNF
jgi:hypothetical protein